MIKTKLIGIGYYVPKKVVKNSELVEYLDTTDEWIQNKIGIKERHIVDEVEVASDLAQKASTRALEMAELEATEIDMILLATNTPDHLSPATAIQLQKKISALNAFAFDIRVGGCPGLIYGISIATNYIASGSCKTVLVATTDVNSRGIDWKDRLTAVIMGDGASAVILKADFTDTNEKIILDSQLGTEPSGYYAAYIPAGGTVEPITVNSIKNNRQYFKMDGKAIYKFATTVFPESVKKILHKNKICLKDVDFIISHQANINIIKESMGKLNIPMEKTYCNIEKYGNTGGSSVGIALAEAVEKGIIKKGDIVVLVAYGAGLSWGTVLLKW